MKPRRRRIARARRREARLVRGCVESLKVRFRAAWAAHKKANPFFGYRMVPMPEHHAIGVTVRQIAVPA